MLGRLHEGIPMETGLKTVVGPGASVRPSPRI